MKSIYILSSESTIVKATASLDEATLWESKGGLVKEVNFSEGTELAAYVEDEQVYVQNEDGERVAEIIPEVYNDPQEHLLHDCSASHYTDSYQVGRVIVDGKLLETINLTEDLNAEIMGACQQIALTQQENR